MRIAYLDCVGGISGDMFVGALLDAGWSEEAWRASVSWLAPEIADLRIERRTHAALAGLGIHVEPAASAVGTPQHHHHGHEALFRNLPQVRARLDDSHLSALVRERVDRVFQRLAEAEGHAHGKPTEEVHFHEVGAVDAMVDIVSVCQGLVDLGIEKLHVSTLPVGRGTIQAAHGAIPLPAPATSYLLQGAPIQWSSAEGERTTPTGAALVTTLGCFDAPPRMALEVVGTGAGGRTLPEVPNLARLFIGRRLEAGEGFPAEIPRWGWGEEEVPGTWSPIVLLSAQMDDATAEEVADALGRLFTAGALDATVSPLGMKKGRPGHLLTCVCRPQEEAPLVDLLLRETSTLGVRRHLEWRRELERRPTTVETPFGPVEVKLALRGERWIGKPEYESCREVASRAGVPLRDVWRAVIAALSERPT